MLKAETAERLLPILGPLLPEGAAISGRGGYLFVRGDERTQAEVRRLLEALDHPPQRLLVQVRDRSSSGARATGADAAVRLGAGPEGTRPGTRVRVYGTDDLRQTSGTDTLQVLAGSPAQIGSGTALAVPLQLLVPIPGGIAVSPAGVDWIEARRETWLLARPTRDGGVLVELAASREALLPGGAGVSGSGLTTTITGPLGVWFDVGSSRTGAGRRQENARVFSTQEFATRADGLQMRVDILP